MSEAGLDGTVYVQTNAPENAVLAFRRAAGGALARRGSYPTAGAGTGKAHLPSQGSVTLAGDRRHLLVTNAASGDVTVFSVSVEGSLVLVGRTPASPGPTSVAERDGLVYVLVTGAPGVAGFRLGDAGLDPIGGEMTLPMADAGADPAQVGFTPDGRALLITDRGTNSLLVFPVRPDGSLEPAQVVASSGPTPYGFAFAGSGTLVVTEAFGAQKGAAAASSYRVDGTVITPVTKSAGNGRSEICWAVVTNDGRYAFTTNFADGAVSRWAIDSDGTVRLDDAVAGVSVDARPGLRDEALTADSRHLYAIDADSGSIFGWTVGPSGTLSPIGAWGGLPVTVAGLAAT